VRRAIGSAFPHVTLDAREAFRAAIVQPFVDAYASGETPNRARAATGASGLRSCWRSPPCRCRPSGHGHYARIVEHRGRSLLARAADSQKDQSYMLARLDPRHLDRIWFPLGEQSKEETRAEAERGGLAVARRAESQEACFLGGGDYRHFLERHGLSGRSGTGCRRDRQDARRARGLLAFHARPASWARRLDRSACLCARQRSGDEHRRRRPEVLARAARGERVGAPSMRRSRAAMRSSVIGLRQSLRTSKQPLTGSFSGSTSRRSALPPARRRSL
jgi:hypothetical protein